MKKKFVSIVLALVMVLGLVVPAIAASNSQVVTGPTTRIWQDGFGFHCNQCGGNGATAVIYNGDNAKVLAAIAKINKKNPNSLTVEKGDQKDIFGTKDYPITLERVGDTTTWNLITGNEIECATCHRKDWVTYSNNSGVINGKNIQAHHGELPDEDPEGELAIEKKIKDGGEYVSITAWLSKNYSNHKAIIDGMVFALYKADGPSGPKGEHVKNGKINEEGTILFGNVAPGWYAVEEKFKGAAVGIFKTPPVWYVLVIDGEKAVINLTGHYESGTVGGGFDYEAKYTIVNGYNSPKRAGLEYKDPVTGENLLNNGGDFFYIGVKSAVTGVEYASFCAHGGSRAFAGESGMGCSGYVVVQRAGMADLENDEMAKSYDKILAALNWIEDNVGPLNAKNGPEGYGLVTTQRVVAQTVIWALLGNIDIESEAFARANLTETERLLVIGALINADGYKGKIIDLVYMVCENHHNFNDCQPQLVPVYESGYIVNAPKEPDEFFGGVSFCKTVYGFDVDSTLKYFGVDIKEFTFDLYKFDDDEEDYVFFKELVKPNDKGVVSVDGLEPGKYVVKEAWSGYYPFMDIFTGWKFVWDDGDGLYFEIDNKGNTIWDYDVDAVPVVNNVLYSKHTVFWTEGYYYGIQVKEKIQLADGSYVTIFNMGFDDRLKLNIQDADCYNAAIWRFTADNDIGGGFEFRVGDALGHDYVYESDHWNFDDIEHPYIDGEWHRCTRCGDATIIFFPPAE